MQDINITIESPGQFSAGKSSQESAQKLSELLRENHVKHHIFFNEQGFHNHIVHHVLALFSLGATPSELEDGYKANAGYQLPLKPLHGTVSQNLIDPTIYKKYLGKRDYYHDYLAFFEREIEAKGYQAVVKEYIFSGDERAEDMFNRLFASIMHSLIHLGYALDHAQPTLVAEALAQTAVHDSWIGNYFSACEAASKAPSTTTSTSTSNTSSSSLLTIALTARSTLPIAPSLNAPSRASHDAILLSAPRTIAPLASAFRVSASLPPSNADSISARTAEMVAFSAYMTASAQRPPHRVKMDFFLLHALNASVLVCALLELPWVGAEEKARILQRKGWMDVALYVSRGCPELRGEEIWGYKGQNGDGDHDDDEAGWEKLFRRACAFVDDGHTSKFVRALAMGEEKFGDVELVEGVVVRGDDWRTMARMVLDSVEGQEETWVRDAGFEEAWKGYPLRSNL